MTVGELIVKIGADISEFVKGVNEVGKKSEKLKAKLNKIANGMLTLGTGMVAGVMAMSKVTMDYNSKMAEVSTLIDGSIDKVEKYKETIKGLAVETGKSFTDMAGGLYQVISSFGETKDTLEILEIAAKDATAGVSTTTDAINLLSAVSKGYGDTSKEMIQKISDLSFMTVKLGQTTFPELASSIGHVVPIASTLGVSVEELYGGFATLTGVTGSASEVATQLRSAMLALLNPSSDLEKAIHDMGYESGQAMIKSLGFGGTLQAIARYSEEAGIPLGKLLGRAEAITATLAIAGPQADVYANKLNMLKNSAGATDEAFKKMADGINKTGFSIQQTKTRLMNLADSVGTTILPYVNQLIGVIERLVSWFNRLPKPMQDFLVKLTLFGGISLIAAGGILKLVNTFSSLISILSSAASGFIALQVAGGPILWIIEAIAAAVVLLYMAWKNNWFGIRDTIQEVMEFLKPYIETAWNFIKTTITMAIRLIHAIITGDWNELRNIASEIWGAIKNIIINVWNAIKEKTSEIWGSIKAGISNLWNSIQTTITSWWEGLVNFGHEIVGRIATGISNAYEGFKSVVNELWSIIWTVINTWWEKLISFGREIVGKIATGIAKAYKGFRKVVNELWEIIKTVFNNAWKGLLDIGRKIVEGIWNGIKGATSWILGKLRSWVGDIMEWLKKMFGIGSPSRITTEYGKLLGLGIVEGIKKTIPEVKTAINKMGDLTKGFSIEPAMSIEGRFGGGIPVPRPIPVVQPMINVNIEKMTGNEEDIYELSRRVADEVRKEILMYQKPDWA